MPFSLFDQINPIHVLGSSNSWIYNLAIAFTAACLLLLLTSLILNKPERPTMIVATALVSGLTALFLADTTVALDPIANPSLNAALLLAPNAVTRESILSNSDYFYDFANCTYSTFDPGSVCNADKATWPILTNAPITITQLQLGPCSLLPAHFHRADNAVVAINGTTHTFMYPEDGGETVEQYLSAGQMTLFPRMSLHTMVNEGQYGPTLFTLCFDPPAPPTSIPPLTVPNL